MDNSEQRSLRRYLTVVGLLIVLFVAGTVVGRLVGLHELGEAATIGQLTFSAGLIYVILKF